MNIRLSLSGLAIWVGATIALRLGGQRLFHAGNTSGTLFVFLVSFPLMALIVRWICRRLPPEQWLRGAVSFALPSLLLDPFSSAFFPVVFPNMAPAVAGVFGGWVLWCCAGTLVGAIIPLSRRA
jgi:ABC-type transport system involved in cytochrome c biogenesis permease component